MRSKCCGLSIWKLPDLMFTCMPLKPGDADDANFPYRCRHVGVNVYKCSGRPVCWKTKLLTVGRDSGTEYTGCYDITLRPGSTATLLTLLTTTKGPAFDPYCYFRVKWLCIQVLWSMIAHVSVVARFDAQRFQIEKCVPTVIWNVHRASRLQI